MLRNQHAVYESLEAAIARCAATDSLLGWLDREALARAAPMERDLVHIHGAGWRDDIPLRREATAYADEIDALGRTEPVGVIAHAWVRYMGDVSGGQILARLVRKHYGLGDEGTETYSFPALGDIDAFKADFRARLDARPDDEGLRMIEHARSGFGHSIALLDALVPE
jgi:heme oxygenase